MNQNKKNHISVKKVLHIFVIISFIISIFGIEKKTDLKAASYGVDYFVFTQDEYENPYIGNIQNTSMKFLDGKITYCLQSGKDLRKGVNYTLKEDLNWSLESKELLAYVLYYGYQEYHGTSKEAYSIDELAQYLATQLLVWQLEYNSFYDMKLKDSFIEHYTGLETSEGVLIGPKLVEYYNDIWEKADIALNRGTPSFTCDSDYIASLNVYGLAYDDEKEGFFLEIEDTNHFLQNYLVTENNGLEVNIEENKITIFSKDEIEDGVVIILENPYFAKGMYPIIWTCDDAAYQELTNASEVVDISKVQYFYVKTEGKPESDENTPDTEDEPGDEPPSEKITEDEPGDEPPSEKITEDEPGDEPPSEKITEDEPGDEPPSEKITEDEPGDEPPSEEVTTEETGEKPPSEEVTTEETEEKTPSEEVTTEESRIEIPTEEVSTEERGGESSTEKVSTEERGGETSTEKVSTEEREEETPTQGVSTEETNVETTTKELTTGEDSGEISTEKIFENNGPDDNLKQTESDDSSDENELLEEEYYYNSSSDNLPEGRIIIEKIDGDTKETLAGVTFAISNYDNSFYIMKETDENGIIDITLPYDNYYLQEISAPAGYATSNEKISFRITNDTPLFFQIINSKVPQLGMNFSLRNIGFFFLFIILVVCLFKELNIFSIKKRKKMHDTQGLNK